jgi:hypothetical protein
MSDQFSMFEPTTSEAIHNATSSRESESGATRLDWPGGQMTVKSGRVPAPANLSARPAKVKRSTTKGIFGPNGSGSSRVVALPSYSESKSQAPASSDTKQCKGCQTIKSLNCFRKHNRGGYRGTCRVCENKWVRTKKPWDSDSKRRYQRDVRNRRRGLSLTTDAKQRAKAKGLPFALDWRNIQARIDGGVCEVTGIPFDLFHPKSWNAPSLDQIVPGLGYTPSNTRVIIYALNAMANNWGFSTILKVADALRQKGIK